MEIYDSFTKACKDAISDQFTDLLSAEVAAKRLFTWGHFGDGSGLAQDQCEAIVERLLATEKVRLSLIEALKRKLKKGQGSVTLLRSSGPPKGYLLNRFLIQLVERLHLDLNKQAGAVKVHFCRLSEHLKTLERAEDSGKPWINPVAAGFPKTPPRFDHTIVRFGFDPEDKSLGRTVMASVRNTASPARVCFSSIGLPLNPPNGGDAHLGKTRKMKGAMTRKLRVGMA